MSSGPRQPRDAPRARLDDAHQRLAEAQRDHQRRERERAGQQRAVEHRHLDHHAAQAVGRERGRLERRVGAQRRPQHDGLLDLEVVEQRDRLLPEEGHRVALRVERAVRAPVAQQVERDHAVAALGEAARERLVHALAEQQAVQEHDDARALAVVRVGQRSPFVAERLHARIMPYAVDRGATVAAVPTIRPMRRDDDLAVHEVSAITFADLTERLHQPPPPPPRADARDRAHPAAAGPRSRRRVGGRGGRRRRRRGARARPRGRLGPVAARRPARAPVERHRARAARALARVRRAAGSAARSSSPRPTRGRCAPTPARASRRIRASAPAAGPRSPSRPRRCATATRATCRSTEAVDRAVRGAPHGSDIGAFLRSHSRLLVVPERGYAVLGGGGDQAARRARRRRGARPAARRAGRDPARRGGRRRLDHRRRSSGRWPRCSTRGWTLKPGGAVFVRGDVGPFRPYLPSGAYL